MLLCILVKEIRAFLSARVSQNKKMFLYHARLTIIFIENNIKRIYPHLIHLRKKIILISMIWSLYFLGDSLKEKDLWTY